MNRPADATLLRIALGCLRREGDDHQRSGDVAAFRRATREHYVEWLSFSLPAVIAKQGGELDPENERAIKMTADELLAEGTVLAVVEKGYLLNDRVLRPALVVVSKAKSPPEA